MGGRGQRPTRVLLLWSPHPLTKLQSGQASGTALPPRTLTHRHAGTLSYHNVKIKGWERGEREKRLFQCLLLGTPGAQVGGLCPRLGPFGIEGEQQGAGGYRVGTSTGIMYKEGGDAPAQPPIGLDWLMGVGCM